MAKIINNVLAVLILGFAAVPGAATANENDDVRATIAHLFPDALHAAAGTCFPKYHLELWRNDVIAHKKIDDRTSQLKLSGASPCAVSEVNWLMLKRYFRSGINGREDNADWKLPRLAGTTQAKPTCSRPTKRTHPTSTAHPRCIRNDALIRRPHAQLKMMKTCNSFVL